MQLINKKYAFQFSSVDIILGIKYKQNTYITINMRLMVYHLKLGPVRQDCKLPVFIVLAAGQGPAPGPAHRYRRLRPLVVPRPHALNKILLYQRTIVYHVYKVQVLLCEPLACSLFKHRIIHTEFPKSYRKSVLHLVKYTASLYLNRCSTDLR